MPVTYTNRKGQVFFLCKGTTKTGKPRFMFTRQPVGEPIEQIPDGYQIQESVNGVVSLVKEHPQIITAKELELIKTHLKRHPKGEDYRADIKGKHIMVYERFGPDREELKAIFGSISLLPFTRLDQQIDEHFDKHASYSPILRFILIDPDKRTFRIERFYSSSPESQRGESVCHHKANGVLTPILVARRFRLRFKQTSKSEFIKLPKKTSKDATRAWKFAFGVSFVISMPTRNLK